MQTFKRFIVEMAQQGFQYETNAAKALKPYDVVPPNFTPAGAGSDIPDLMIKLPGAGNPPKGCELKITAASAGSLVMKWDPKQGWSIGNPNETDDEKLFIMELAKEVGIIDELNKKWKSEPYKFTKNSKILDEIKDLDKRAAYTAERLRFPEIKGTIPATKIEDYYNKKKTYYVNVGTNGFYLLGNSNPLNLKGLPRFGTAAKAGYRARVQSKGGGNYQFTFEMSFSIPKAQNSPYNIAPTVGKTVNINTEVMLKTLKDLFGVEL